MLRCVTTCVVVWIEILVLSDWMCASGVTTCVVVWIEITNAGFPGFLTTSPPAWWCGLKSPSQPLSSQQLHVTTCVVVWIEIVYSFHDIVTGPVTTCVVVWIEINIVTKTLPAVIVTTCVVVWIEIFQI